MSHDGGPPFISEESFAECRAGPQIEQGSQAGGRTFDPVQRIRLRLLLLCIGCVLF